VHGGWKPVRALVFNAISALTFLLGGIAAYFSSRVADMSFLLPLAARNFIYIAAADRIPEVKHHTSMARNILHSIAFLAGIGLLLAVRLLLD
jgi:zinc and cadmium transporter